MEKKATGITGEIKDYLINSIATTVSTSKKIKEPYFITDIYTPD